MNETLRTVFMRISMVVFWFLIMVGLLFAPTIMRLFSRQKSITVFTWPMVIDAKVLKQFEQETGVHVYLSYYESNTELYSKLRATQGKGYDLIIPTHYLVPRLIKRDYIKKLDKEKIPFFASLRPELMNHYYDPHNEYALPYFWGVIGLGVDTTQVQGDHELGWSSLFDQKLITRPIGMTDDPYEAIFIAAQYLFNPLPDQLNGAQITQIKNLLREQKKWVELYSDTRAGELLASHACAIATGLSADIWKFKREYAHIDFRLPREGGILLIDAMVIPSSTNKDDLVYQFINFLYRPDILEHHVAKFSFCPPLSTLPVPPSMEKFLQTSALRKADLFRLLMSPAQINDLWIAVLAD